MTGTLRDLLTLTKPRITSMVCLTTAAGAYMGAPGGVSAALLVPLLGGTALVAGGTSALNMWLERGIDARMERTRNRPIPSGRLTPVHGLVFGLAISVVGLAWLAAAVGWLPAGLAAFTWASYLGVYTPLKSRTPLCIPIGAIPGAMPPVIGWAAVASPWSATAWLPFAIIFAWQIPHVLAIAWMHRSDYRRAGLAMLPGGDPGGPTLAGQVLASSGLLLVVSLVPVLLGAAGRGYGAVALAAGLLFCAAGAAFVGRPTRHRARGVVLASVVYLPVVLALLALGAA